MLERYFEACICDTVFVLIFLVFGQISSQGTLSHPGYDSLPFPALLHIPSDILLVVMMRAKKISYEKKKKPNMQLLTTKQ